MRNYRLTFWSKPGRREGTFPFMADCDRDAFERASRMLSRSDCMSFELWRDTSFIAKAHRDTGYIPSALSKG